MLINKFKLFSVAIAILFCLMQNSAKADGYTECTVTPQRAFIGEGILWVVYVEGGVGVISTSDTNYNSILAAVMTAISMQKMLTVRYRVPNVSCTSQQTITGVWLSR